MPVDLELFLSQTGASLFDYSPFVENRFSYSNNYDDDGFIRSYPFPQNHILIPKDPKRMPCFEKKKHLNSYSCGSDFKSSKKLITYGHKRKKVSFADDKGFRLVEIREIPGSPVSPTAPTIPVINDAINVSNVQKSWKIASKNPPWTDSKLTELLETNKVALESATIKMKAEGPLDKVMKAKNFRPVLKVSSSNNENTLQGNIKVKNLSYVKNVFVRITFDRWLSSVDVKATYLKPDKNTVEHYEYDNFTFVIDIPSSAFKYEVIEFCVGYFCDGKKYWDNNGGVNYRLTTEVVENKTVEQRYPQNKKLNESITLSLTENIERFSEIDSWSNFINNQPYW